MKPTKPPQKLVMQTAFSHRYALPGVQGQMAVQNELNQLLALFNQQRFAEVETRATALLAQQPRLGQAWKVLCAALLAQNKDGLLAAQRAVELLPRDAEAHSNLGHALQDAKRLDEAIASFRQALALQPGLAEAHNNLGTALREQGQRDEAMACFQAALRLDPRSAEAYNNLGVALTDAGRLQDAFNSLRKALELRPNYAHAFVNLGTALLELGKYELAATSFDRAQVLSPKLHTAYFGLGEVLRHLGEYENAKKNFEQALALKPNYAEAHTSIGSTLVGMGQLEEGLAQYRTALAIQPSFAEALGGMLFAQNYLGSLAPEQMFADAQRYGDIVSGSVVPYTTWLGSTDAQRKLRIGIVSGDLKSHPVGYFVEGVVGALQAFHSDSLELLAYHTDRTEDALTARIKPRFVQWQSTIGLNNEQLAQRIHEDRVDILIDLSGHTGHNRLPAFAWKPAPVQVSWLGYFATTGVPAIDYLIADPHTLPPDQEKYFTESIWRLPETRLCFTAPEEQVAVAPLPALANGHITFGCFNNLSKFNDQVIALWSRLLLRLPDSRLMLKAKPFDDPVVRDSLLQRFARHGVGAERLILEGVSPRQQYLETYHRVDIGLDPFPYTGGTTTAESLWMGVPVLTLAGDSFLARQGVGLLTNAGLPDWIATDADDYLAKAIAQAQDLPRLAALRASLRDQVLASPVFDAPRFAGHFVQALRGMWTRWCERATG